MPPRSRPYVAWAVIVLLLVVQQWLQAERQRSRDALQTRQHGEVMATLAWLAAKR